ncbi:NYN domain-containing protein [Bradyrhizobium roseum]|uniref:NYN domain-containing protein n=1 Tax=Bradyrhizobium roseum TaxID=3056648 RepID=UPI0026049AAF|nr:NYN domain-containing protein [Bradyrhizobium roseus]WKA26219.1 NYN domain-containing protein [Bradyrhizobium roseus]
MRTIIYVDGFNLYYRMLEQRPDLKWLDIKQVAEKTLRPENQVIGVRYYTARVSGRHDPQAPGRQQVYFDALSTIPEISLHMGNFLSAKKFAGLVHPPSFRPHLAAPLPQPWPVVVRVHKTEEKGSDVNLASHLLLGAFRNDYDVAAVLSNDTDLVEPIRIATRELGKVVGLLSPVSAPAPQLRAVSSFVRHIKISDLASSQFPDPIILPDGTALIKPATWV